MATETNDLASAVAKILIEDVDRKRVKASVDSNREADQRTAIAIEAKMNAEMTAAMGSASIEANYNKNAVTKAAAAAAASAAAAAAGRQRNADTSVADQGPPAISLPHQPMAKETDDLASAVAKILIEDVDRKRVKAISDSNREADQRMAIAIEANNKRNAEMIANAIEANNSKTAVLMAATMASELPKFFPKGNPAQTDSASNEFQPTAKAGGLSEAPGATK